MPILEALQGYGPIFVIAGGLATVLGVAFTIYKASHDRHLRMLRERIEELEHQLAALNGDPPRSADEGAAAALRLELDSARSALATLNGDLAAAKGESERKETAVRQMSAELENAREGAANLEQEIKSRNNKIRHALQLEGRIWELKALRGVPRFRPLRERRTAIISMLNLKGGVGKTTVAAHLGSALSQRGYRVLLVDLDLQGSLSSLFLPLDRLSQLSKEAKLLQDYLASASAARKTNLLEYATPILDGRSAVVATTDRLAYAELNLTMQWLLRIGKRDTRFLLRRGLHQRRVMGRYDVVLLDCPPLINTCCVNALAASDYVLIPVTPSRKAADRAPQLLYTLKQLCGVINPDLLVAGLLANRTHGVTFTQKEQELWNTLRVQCKDQWEEPVHSFETMIRQSPEIRENENEFQPAEEGSDMHAAFHRLAKELEERLPSECRRTATARP